MIYFKVKQCSSQYKHNIRFKNNFFIGGELYTIREVDKSSHDREFIHKHLDRIEISKRNVFWIFGQRKEKTIN